MAKARKAARAERARSLSLAPFLGDSQQAKATAANTGSALNFDEMANPAAAPARKASILPLLLVSLAEK
jgi:hypothetical protein